VRRDELKELHFITSMSNVSSIIQHGILSHVRADKLTGGAHVSIAMDEIQEIRAKTRVPNGRMLHEYTNLYICGRNPMMYKRKALRETLCVLRVSPDVLDLPGAVVTDGNSASPGGWTNFKAAPSGLAIVDHDLTFAEFWTSSDLFDYYRRKRAKFAEVLVPDRVPPEFLVGAWVCSQEAKEKFDALETGLTCEVDGHLFFV
jgi:hypothetical protein